MESAFDTIAALSTPPGESGIAVVRMSGPEALEILRAVFRRPRSAERFGGDWEHRRIYRGSIAGDDKEPIDTVMCAVMLAPDTYTGEDIVEISCHGGGVIVSAILGLLYTKGARPAGPGEFTKRAFLNGKLDLIQAEAVADLIHARSELQRRVAHEQLSGGLSNRVSGLADQITELLGIIEVNIDFIEEDIDTLDRGAAIALLGKHRDELDDLLSSAPFSKPFRDGYRVTIAGPVNAGKSSLFNRLVGEQRAIVTEIPGTTRDVLREPVLLEGLLFFFNDTAGLRQETADRIETIGIDLANEAVRAADVVLYVLDVTQTPDDAGLPLAGAPDGPNVIYVLNKIDLPQRGATNTLLRSPAAERVVRVSALTGEGVDTLEQTLLDTVAGDTLSRMARERVVLNGRLVSLLEAAKDATEKLIISLEADNPLETMAIEARWVLGLYEEATGRRYYDGLLDEIFSKFCLGK